MGDQSKSQIVSVEDLKVDSTDSPASTTYHIYHTGKGKRPPNYSVHLLRDSETTILKPIKVKKTKEEKKQAKADKKKAKAEAKALKKANATTATSLLTTLHNGDLQQNKAQDDPLTTELTSAESKPKGPEPELIPVKGLKKLTLYDNPLRDPRVPTTPYFVHLPKLFGHEPAYTLRNGGHKSSPVAALLHPSTLWMGWKLEFGDVLKQEGVIDGRGVVNGRFGTKDGKDGYLKGYKVRKRRYWGENGKSYWLKQKEEGFPDNVERGEGEKVRPEEVVKLKWVRFWKRDYGFSWRECVFLWKGTGKVDVPRRAAKAFVWCNHLKLVVCRDGDGEKGELMLARYVCVMGNRKAGRLEVYDDTLEEFLRESVFKDRQGAGGPSIENKEVATDERLLVTGGDISRSEEYTKTYQRFRDVIMGTMICMLITERDKRRFILEFLQEVGENAGG